MLVRKASSGIIYTSLMQSIWSLHQPRRCVTDAAALSGGGSGSLCVRLQQCQQKITAGLFQRLITRQCSVTASLGSRLKKESRKHLKKTNPPRPPLKQRATMVTRIKELEKHQTSKDVVSVLDFRLIELWEHFPFTLFSTAPLVSDLFSYFMFTG